MSNWQETFKTNRPLLFSTLTGLFYFLFCWSIDFCDETKGLFISLMLFLPGLTFPLATRCYTTEKNPLSGIRQYGHLVLSIGIYNGSVWLFSGGGQIKYLTVLAGFSGSILFLLATKYLLKKDLSLLQILITALLSGLAFLPYAIHGRDGIFLGISVFLWTMVNGLLLNNDYRRAKLR